MEHTTIARRITIKIEFTLIREFSFVGSLISFFTKIIIPNITINDVSVGFMLFLASKFDIIAV